MSDRIRKFVETRVIGLSILYRRHLLLEGFAARLDRRIELSLSEGRSLIIRSIDQGVAHEET